MSYRALMFVASLGLAAPLAAQDAAVIDPGMTRAEVVERLGKPMNERKSGGHTYLYYRNGCERTCGMNDVVMLDDGKVSDAIFRAASRHYSGESSSPNGVQPARSEGGDAGVAAVRKAKRGGIVIARPADAEPATVTGVQVVPAEGVAPNAEAAVNAAPVRTSTAGGGARPAPSGPRPGGVVANTGNATTSGARPDAAAESGTGSSGVGTGGGGTAGGNAPQVTSPAGNAPQVGSPEPAASPSAPVSASGQRPIMPVPLPGAKVNPADSVRALTPNRPTPLPGAKINPADSIRAEAIRRQQADTTNKP